MKILALLSIIVALAGCARISDVQSYTSCDVYTYFNKAQNNFAGLVYLDNDLERMLISKIPNHDETDKYCWYTKNNNLVGQLVVAKYKPSIAHTFEKKSSGWELVESNEIINLPAHQ